MRAMAGENDRSEGALAEQLKLSVVDLDFEFISSVEQASSSGRPWSVKLIRYKQVLSMVRSQLLSIGSRVT